ncbi:DUF5018 domain-containing protein [Sphingobacterium chuzhouense]|uniref:DUF5018 domain-containing protein n=1 Tax=Sphingobacterium chuzhouense TaxID=1742264 RepID=A0ABR7XUQ9_9SPHI|nr:DUF5018 domain-containing protein [Sphingobacterium chuzhouense]MBD1422794.1 DUF5018 domain-containing protein [Sphingobacterium chuzhouense]
MMKRKIYILLFSLVSLLSCDKKVEVERGTGNELSDIFANIEGSGPDRLFEPRYSNDTIYFDIPYYYPVDSDFETDLSKIILRASIPSDAFVSMKFGDPIDLRRPLNFSVISGVGVEKKYIINAKKVGDTHILDAKISFEQDGIVQTVEAVLVNDELRFFIDPEIDMSKTIITFSINRHASSSIKSGTTLNLNENQLITVSAPGDVHKTYTIRVMEPVKLPYGFGVNRPMWLKLGADLGFTGANETAIAISGDYLVVTKTGTVGNSQYRVFDRFTGEYIRDMYMPFTAGSGAFSQSNQLVADAKGNLLSINRAAYGQTIHIYKYDDPFDENPELLINTTNVNDLLPTTADRSTGRRLNIAGDLNGNAVITTSASVTKSFYCWEIKNGMLTSKIPTLITIEGTTGNHHGYVPEVQYINPIITSNYLLGYQSDFSYINGTTNKQINAVSLSNRGNTTFMNALAIGTFNHATYAFLGRYFSNYDLNRMGLSMFDITDPQMLSIETSSSQYPSFNVFNSETLISTVATSGTGDIAIGYSDDGDRMQVYMLHTGYGIWAHEFTVYSAN